MRTRRLAAGALAGPAALLLAGCAGQGATTQGQDIHRLYLVIIVLAAPVFVGVEGFLVWCLLRYRRRDDSPAPQSAGGPRSLAVFFAIPTVIVAFLYPFGERTLASVQRPEPNPAVEIRVEGFQWQWTFYYLKEGFYETGRTLTREALMVLPVGEPVHVRLEARDVVHEFYVPEFLFMRNALPGRPNEFSFTPTRIGTFRGQCAEFCGLHHAQMTFVLKVVSQADYIAWVAREKQAARNVDCAPVAPIQLISKNNVWNTACLAVARNVPFPVTLVNQDAGIEHNFAVYSSDKRTSTLFQSPRLTGPAQQTYRLQPLPKGRYYFQCDVHGPAMSGSLVVK